MWELETYFTFWVIVRVLHISAMTILEQLIPWGTPSAFAPCTSFIKWKKKIIFLVRTLQ